MCKILVTGGCGFIGYNFLEYIHNNTTHDIINVDKLTYAGATQPKWIDRYEFYHQDIGASDHMRALLKHHKPDYVVNFAAETHVDRSISSSKAFIDTNIVATYNFIVEIQKYFEEVNNEVRFVHVSTDEVYGELATPQEAPFSEESPYKPNNPYSATKASGDFLIRSFQRTYGLPAMITNSSNNYGPYQYPEKFIPVVILKAMLNKQIPVYGTGKNVRDWIWVEDNCDAIYTVLQKGTIGEKYNIGAYNEHQNIEIAKLILDIMGKPQSLISFVEDRKGHDLRYALESIKMKKEFNWQATHPFTTTLDTTIKWYHDNLDWVKKCIHLESF